MRVIRIEPLSKAAFAPFGDVVETEGAARVAINQGFAERFDKLACIDVAAGEGRATAAIFEARARPRPIAIRLMERHPLGTQLFYPLQDEPWLVLVCTHPGEASTYRAFRASGRQGVNYARNVWHHPLLVLGAAAVFLVVDRIGPGDNLEEFWLPDDRILHLAPGE